MKPSERIQELCSVICEENGTVSPTTEQLQVARVEAIVRYLDELDAVSQEPTDP